MAPLNIVVFTAISVLTMAMVVYLVYTYIVDKCRNVYEKVTNSFIRRRIHRWEQEELHREMPRYWMGSH